MTLHDMILGAWAIEPGMLREIQGIYAMHLRGEKLDLDAIEARLGRPLAHEQQEYEVLPGGVALLKLSGVMAPKANLFMRVSGGISTRQATLQIESALADARVRSIVVAMDTPGGNVIGVPEFAQAIHDAGAIKPLVVHASEMLLSAGMWSGSGANAIFVSGSVVSVGSIGVVVDREFDPRLACSRKASQRANTSACPSRTSPCPMRPGPLFRRTSTTSTRCSWTTLRVTGASAPSKFWSTWPMAACSVASRPSMRGWWTVSPLSTHCWTAWPQIPPSSHRAARP